MVILWDERKRLANIDKHGIDFADIAPEFFLHAMVVPAKLGGMMAIGRRADGALVVVFAELGAEAISIISARPASQKERELLR
ncbi:BrnT family toxin [Kaistia geumhonensis]|uniref:Uncharacterized DUF497 family protein n=1 Tax=Kaistia geumhonensis TaxID=410839 RepID=A0ABU0M617_9HYPH|nr:BrnT family toxin [Kaistia geumhonensis]MCX5478512.1 BrnT family toxin [Kaistia geumhonensis]MDQ0516270.1 uncharacterized DUF497 family protein [Kaistia geumhonensis]